MKRERKIRIGSAPRPKGESVGLKPHELCGKKEKGFSPGPFLAGGNVWLAMRSAAEMQAREKQPHQDNSFTVCGKRAFFRGSELQLRHKGLALNALQRRRTLFTAFFRSLFSRGRFCSTTTPSRNRRSDRDRGPERPSGAEGPLLGLRGCLPSYSTTTPNRNVRNPLKTNDRCTFYSTINRGASAPDFAPSTVGAADGSPARRAGEQSRRHPERRRCDTFALGDLVRSPRALWVVASHGILRGATAQKSPTNRHTMQSLFQPISLKTNDRHPYKVTHFFEDLLGAPNLSRARRGISRLAFFPAVSCALSASSASRTAR